MAEISLYRKYRPQTFSHLVGQDHVRKTLLYAIQQGHIAHAYLFTGPRGTGKTTTARLFAKALNCVALSPEGEPCEACDICRDITEGRLIDVIEIDAASNTGVDDMRDLIDKLHFAPTRAKNKIYIVDEVHMLSKGAFNAFLKTLEEPPSNVYFVLATTEVHKVPDTIISRCQRFDFKRIDAKTIMARLAYIAQTEGIAVDDEALELIARYSDGGLRDAIGLFEQLIVDRAVRTDYVRTVLRTSGSNALDRFFEVLIGGGVAAGDSAGAMVAGAGAGAALHLLQDFYREGIDFTIFVRDVMERLRGELLAAVDAHEDKRIVVLLRLVEVFRVAQEQLKSTLIPQLPLEVAVIKFFHESTIATVATVATVAAVAPTSRTSTVNTVKPESGIKSESKPSFSAPAASTTPATPVTTASSSSRPLTYGTLESSWPRIMERIKTPKLRVSLRDVRRFDTDGVNITLFVTAKFHQDTVMETALRVELERLIGEVCGSPVKVTTVLERMELRSSLDNEDSRYHVAQPAPEDVVPTAGVAEVADEQAATDVADILGGEVME